jgi:hypothetical protein
MPSDKKNRQQIIALLSTADDFHRGGAVLNFLREVDFWMGKWLPCTIRNS